MFRYGDRLQKDVERWHKAGWLTEEGVEALRAEAAGVAGNQGFGLAGVLGVLGAVLIGFAAMSFVASNWQSMSKLARLGLLFSGLWGSYAVAGLLFARRLPAFANAAVLAGVALFGASIMLIAQMYHIEGNPPDAVLIWALGAVLAGVLLRSNAALVAAVPLGLLWSLWQMNLADIVHLPYLPLWVLIATGFYALRWWPGLHLSAFSLSFWVIAQGFVNFGALTYWLAPAIGLPVAFVAALAGPAIDRKVFATAPVSKALVVHGASLAFAGLYVVQFLQPIGQIKLLTVAIATLCLLIAAIWWGAMNENRGVLWLGYAGFSLEILSLYFKTLGTLLSTSLFFLIAGALVIALAYVAFQLHKRQTMQAQVQS